MNASIQVHGELPVQAEIPRMRDQPRFQAGLDLVALPTAVSVARVFVSNTMRQWGATFIEPDMEAIAAELVSMAVAATGPAEGASWRDIRKIGAIKVCLVGWQRHIVVEVSDKHRDELVLPAGVELPSDHGLGLINLRAGRWGSCLIASGRVMWAELPVYERTPAGLPQRTRMPPPTAHTDTSGSKQPDEAHVKVLCRVRDGLKRL